MNTPLISTYSESIIKDSILFSLPMVILAVLAHTYIHYQEISLSLLNASLMAFILVVVNIVSLSFSIFIIDLPKSIILSYFRSLRFLVYLVYSSMLLRSP